MKLLQVTILAIAFGSSCSSLPTLGGIFGDILISKGEKVRRKLKEDASPYTTKRVKVCKRNYLLIEKCEWEPRVVRKDGLPMTPEEEREFNQ